MWKYLVNSTYCVYMLDVKRLHFSDSVFTISRVVEEVRHERGLIDAPLVGFHKAEVDVESKMLSDTDMELLQTAKAMDFVLVTDDKKLIAASHLNNVRVLDTPHFLHRLLIEGKWDENTTLSVLEELRNFYNRSHVIDRVVKDIENWR